MSDQPRMLVVGAAIIRDGAVIMPRGPDVVRKDDRVIVFALPHAIAEIERLFA